MSNRDPYYGPPLWWLAAYVAATAAVAWLYYSTAYGAPAPFVAPPKPLAVAPGSYSSMLWHGVDCGPLHLHADGGYRLLWRGEWWAGKWHCKDGYFFVEEWPDTFDSRGRISWSVKLSSPTGGKELDFWAWKIVPEKKKVY